MEASSGMGNGSRGRAVGAPPEAMVLPHYRQLTRTRCDGGRRAWCLNLQAGLFFAPPDTMAKWQTRSILNRKHLSTDVLRTEASLPRGLNERGKLASAG